MSEQEIQDKIKQEVEGNPILLFMKGDPSAPQCGFSARVVHVLNQYGVKFQSIDILEDWDLREGVKRFSNWPTFPQLYVKGKLIGGCDITEQLHRKGELGDILKQGT